MFRAALMLLLVVACVSSSSAQDVVFGAGGDDTQVAPEAPQFELVEPMSRSGDESSDNSAVFSIDSRAGTDTNCACVTTGLCAVPTIPIGTDGAGGIDLRIVTNASSVTTTCPAGQVLCCTGGNTNIPTSPPVTPTPGVFPTLIPPPTSAPSGNVTTTCGLRYPVPAYTAPTVGQAAFGEFPWQAVLFGPGDVTLGSGALIDNNDVITAAHKVANSVNNATSMRVRLGEYDGGKTTEPIPYQTFPVARITIHPAYNAGNLQNDIAVIRLATNVALGSVPIIGTVCLPNTQYTNCRAWVSGWGKDAFTGTYQTVQKKVDVPILDPTTCQTELRATRLGAGYVYNSGSFICAGGEAGKDACTGDGGSPLVCQSGTQNFVAGLVAWGIGCGTSNVPGVYVNVANYNAWILQTAA